jgi:hypothetical protein
MSCLKVFVALIACAPFIVTASGKSCERFAQPSKDPMATASRKVQTGVWGGDHIIIDVTDGGAKIMYDCAEGVIEQPIETDDNGRFDVRGAHIRNHGGPVRSDEKPDRHRARYAGRVNGKTMTLTVTLADTNETIGTFSLTYGERPELKRCL